MHEPLMIRDLLDGHLCIPLLGGTTASGSSEELEKRVS
jgi:hypothetical protein